MDRQQSNVESFFTPALIHQEEEPNIFELNNNTSNICKDINALDIALIDSSKRLKNLLDATKLRLNSIKFFLTCEKERQEDMNILCNRYSEFSSAMSLENKDFSGDLTFENGVISAKLKSYELVDCEIIDINGNGYEGNNYVYNNNDFLNLTIDSSKRNALIDRNLATYYEYSRITVGNTIEGAPNSFNKDSTEAECSIELKSDKLINKLLINSDRDDIVLSKVFTSIDGLVYKLDTEYNVSMNERYDRYNNQTYIYGSGIIAIQPSKYIKLFFRSKGYANETIAFINTFYNNVGDHSNIIKKIEKVDEAKRHVIKINEISTYNNKYDKGYILSKELITDPINSIALYCNEYINKDYAIDNNVTYFLILNGVEHEVKPINSHRNGKKIIRMSAQSYNSEHVVYLNEDIKSAKLKVVINSSSQDVTPYVSDIKVLIGGSTIE